jgi:hypothetical protein
MCTLVLHEVRRRDGDHTFRLIEPKLMIDAVEAPCDSPLSGACLAAAHTASLRKGLGRSEDFLRNSECDVGRARNGYRLNDTGFVGGAQLSAISLRASTARRDANTSPGLA